MSEKNWKLETIAVQTGYTPENGGPRVQPLVQSTTFKYNSEVAFELPSDLNTYVYIGYDEGDEGETELVPQD